MSGQLLDAFVFVFGITLAACALVAIDRYEHRRRWRTLPVQPRVWCPACGSTFRLGDNGRTVTCTPKCAAEWFGTPTESEGP